MATKLKVLQVLEDGQFYTVKEILEKIPDVSEKVIEYNCRMLTKQWFLKREKVSPTVIYDVFGGEKGRKSKAFKYMITERGLKRLQFFNKEGR